jgi:outer membrane immunogenic protein
MTLRIWFGAATLLMLATSARAADMALPPQIKAPPLMPFTWTGCYLGGHVGYGWSSMSATDPVLLVQDGILGPGTTVGTTTAQMTPGGAVFGGQLGCDYQFSPAWVMGVEGAFSAATIKGSRGVALSTGEIETIAINTDLMPAVTARLGYAANTWLFYAKGGVAWSSNKYSITGTYTGIPFDAEGLSGLRVGWTAGAGVEWAFARDWSARLEYDYYDFGTASVNMIDAGNGGTNPGYMGPVSYRQTTQTVKLGLNFHVWGWQ